MRPVPFGLATIGVVLVGVVPVGKGEVDWGTKHVPELPQVAVLKVPFCHVGTNPLCPVSTGGVPGFPLAAGFASAVPAPAVKLTTAAAAAMPARPTTFVTLARFPGLLCDAIPQSSF